MGAPESRKWKLDVKCGAFVAAGAFRPNASIVSPHKEVGGEESKADATETGEVASSPWANSSKMRGNSPSVIPRPLSATSICRFPPALKERTVIWPLKG